MAVTEYQERVYSLLRQIPRGKVSSYAALSQALASSPRAVGGALRRNPFAPEVPCHRYVSFFCMSGLDPIALHHSFRDRHDCGISGKL
ncbi:Methylated-DNA--protein-cysteine methyltransferase [Lachnellula suecica]|uniref:Methylated-DNA--protein-cysteine methyltransferase n=1 Tax=Lachnellula suecica TaxID=602035 RepID=A0A8T9BZP4_9HELO|nr:Methylated-DNA--protein-cysteine methyltransferase [Lachnellula suecica]